MVQYEVFVGSLGIGSHFNNPRNNMNISGISPKLRAIYANVQDFVQSYDAG